jgi:hypothetical protein
VMIPMSMTVMLFWVSTRHADRCSACSLSDMLRETFSAYCFSLEHAERTRPSHSESARLGIRCRHSVWQRRSKPDVFVLKPAPLKTRSLTLGVADPFGVTAQGALPVPRKLCKLPWCPRARMLNTQTGHAPFCSSRAINIGRSWHTGGPPELMEFPEFLPEIPLRYRPRPTV